MGIIQVIIIKILSLLHALTLVGHRWVNGVVIITKTPALNFTCLKKKKKEDIYMHYALVCASLVENKRLFKI